MGVSTYLWNTLFLPFNVLKFIAPVLDFVISYRIHQISVLLWPIFMATASYEGEAIMLPCWVSEWVSGTIECKQPFRLQRSMPNSTRYSSLFAFFCFRTSSGVKRLVTISLNRLGYYSELASDHTVSWCCLFFLSEY